MKGDPLPWWRFWARVRPWHRTRDDVWNATDNRLALSRGWWEA